VSQAVEKAYRFRFYPTFEQLNYFAKTFGCCRWVYNEFLDRKQQAWKNDKHTLNYNECSALLPELKKKNPWLKEVSSVCLQQSLRRLEKAYERFFSGKARFPRRKKRRYKQSATFTRASFRFKEGKVYLGRCSEALNIRFSRELSGQPSSVIISRDSADRYYISMIVQEEISPLPFKTKMIGMDLGLNSLVKDQDGNSIVNPRYLKQGLKQLKIKQKALSRKEKGSKNRGKARKKLARRHAYVQDMRNDYLHKVSRKIVNENQVIICETLQVKKMLKEKKLSQAISDVGWGKFLRFLEYKSHWYGREFVQVDQFFPGSKMCSSCGEIQKELPLKIRFWKCPNCKSEHDRDTNAARNLLKEGMKILADKDKKYRGAHGN